MKLHEENEPFFITEDMAAEMAGAGYEFKPPGHAGGPPAWQNAARPT